MQRSGANPGGRDCVYGQPGWTRRLRDGGGISAGAFRLARRVLRHGRRQSPVHLGMVRFLSGEADRAAAVRRRDLAPCFLAVPAALSLYLGHRVWPDGLSVRVLLLRELASRVSGAGTQDDVAAIRNRRRSAV